MRSALLSGGSSWGVAEGAPRFLPLAGLTSNSAESATQGFPMPDVGGPAYIEQFESIHSIAPGAGYGILLEFVINGVVSEAMKLEVVSPNTSAKWTGKLKVEKGDKVCVKVTATGVGFNNTFINQNASIITWITCPGDIFLMPYGTGNTPAAAATEAVYGGVIGFGLPALTTAQGTLKVPVPDAGTIISHAAYLNLTAGGGAKSYSVAAFVNGATAGLATVLTEANTVVHSAAGELALVKGDSLETKFTPSGSPATSRFVRGCFAIKATTPGRSWFGAISTTDPTTGATVNVQLPWGYRTGAWGTGSSSQSGAGSLTEWGDPFIELGQAPGAAKSYSFRFRKNAVNQEPIVKIENAAKTGSAEGFFSIGESPSTERVQLSSAAAGTPAATLGVRFSFVLKVPQPAGEKTVVDGEAELSGKGESAVTGSVRKNSDATISGTGTSSIQGSKRANAEATILGTGSNAINGSRRVNGAADLIGEGTMNDEGDVVSDGAASLQGSGTMIVSGSVRRSGVATLSGNGALAANGSKRVAASSTASGVGTLTVVGQARVDSEAVLSGAGALEASGSIFGDIDADYGGRSGSTYDGGDDLIYNGRGAASYG